MAILMKNTGYAYASAEAKTTGRQTLDGGDDDL